MISINFSDVTKYLQLDKEKFELYFIFILLPLLFSAIMFPIIFYWYVVWIYKKVLLEWLILIGGLFLYKKLLSLKNKYFTEYLEEVMVVMFFKILFFKFFSGDETLKKLIYSSRNSHKKLSKTEREELFLGTLEKLKERIMMHLVYEPYFKISLISSFIYVIATFLFIVWGFMLTSIVDFLTDAFSIYSTVFYLMYLIPLFIFLFSFNLISDIDIVSRYLPSFHLISFIKTKKEDEVIGIIKEKNNDILKVITVNVIEKENGLFYILPLDIEINKSEIVTIEHYYWHPNILTPID